MWEWQIGYPTGQPSNRRTTYSLYGKGYRSNIGKEKCRELPLGVPIGQRIYGAAAAQNWKKNKIRSDVGNVTMHSISNAAMLMPQTKRNQQTKKSGSNKNNLGETCFLFVCVTVFAAALISLSALEFIPISFLFYAFFSVLQSVFFCWPPVCAFQWFLVWP